MTHNNQNDLATSASDRSNNVQHINKFPNLVQEWLSKFKPPAFGVEALDTYCYGWKPKTNLALFGKSAKDVSQLTTTLAENFVKNADGCAVWFNYDELENLVSEQAISFPVCTEDQGNIIWVPSFQGTPSPDQPLLIVIQMRTPQFYLLDNGFNSGLIAAIDNLVDQLKVMYPTYRMLWQFTIADDGSEAAFEQLIGVNVMDDEVNIVAVVEDDCEAQSERSLTILKNDYGSTGEASFNLKSYQ